MESRLHCFAVMNSAAIDPTDFDTILISELETLKEGEERLKRLYPQLHTRPQMRDFFLSELSEVKRRTQRLHAILNPFEAFDPPAAEYSKPRLSPAA